LILKKSESCLQFDDDNEIAYILQIEEIVLSENEIHDKTVKQVKSRAIYIFEKS
jgi:hypothetical protein